MESQRTTTLIEGRSIAFRALERARHAATPNQHYINTANQLLIDMIIRCEISMRRDGGSEHIIAFYRNAIASYTH